MCSRRLHGVRGVKSEGNAASCRIGSITKFEQKMVVHAGSFYRDGLIFGIDRTVSTLVKIIRGLRKEKENKQKAKKTNQKPKAESTEQVIDDDIEFHPIEDEKGKVTSSIDPKTKVIKGSGKLRAFFDTHVEEKKQTVHDEKTPSRHNKGETKSRKKKEKPQEKKEKPQEKKEENLDQLLNVKGTERMKYLFEQIGDQKLLVSILEEEKFPESEEELIKKAEKSMGWIDFQTLHTDYGTLYLGRSKFTKEGRVLEKCLQPENSDYLLPILSVHARTKGPKTFRICFTNKGTFRTTKGCWCKTTKGAISSDKVFTKEHARCHPAAFSSFDEFQKAKIDGKIESVFHSKKLKQIEFSLYFCPVVFYGRPLNKARLKKKKK
jgi:hypothetical protein